MHNCPDCDAEITLADINVANDIALCRSCKTTHSFAQLCNFESISTDLLKEKPPRHISLLQDMGDGPGIIYKKKSWVLLFMLPFTCVWAGGSMFGIYGQQFIEGKFDLQQSLFGIPFLIGSIILSAVCLYMLVGKWRIVCDSSIVSIFVGVGPIGWTRRIPYNRHSQVGIVDSSVRHNNVVQQCISIKTDADERKFGAGINNDSLEFIAAFILRNIKNA
ncbi:MAG: hypothetical protein HRT88_02725 [Lentisphaeraceae bacterium]|nr:hypothetical protein [Lentisphaeraceae bacterium]